MCAYFAAETGCGKTLKKGNTPDVLNGIAYDGKTGHLLVTGKLWPALFEIATETVLPSFSNTAY